MTISKKHLIQLVQIYKKAHMEYELIRTELIRNRLNDDVLDIFDVLKMELEAFGKRNCKNFNDLIFSTALDIAEKQNKEEHENIKAIRKETQRNLDLKDNI
jgi:hypothetical protein|tara:strand:+ start:281 stop:583 length:303 start_codon:yes stop_codon:yes gene_type:complete